MPGRSATPKFVYVCGIQPSADGTKALPKRKRAAKFILVMAILSLYLFSSNNKQTISSKRTRESVSFGLLFLFFCIRDSRGRHRGDAEERVREIHRIHEAFQNAWGDDVSRATTSPRSKKIVPAAAVCLFSLSTNKPFTVTSDAIQTPYIPYHTSLIHTAAVNASVCVVWLAVHGCSVKDPRGRHHGVTAKKEFGKKRI